jgi:hypothetical protein
MLGTMKRACHVSPSVRHNIEKTKNHPEYEPVIHPVKVATRKHRGTGYSHDAYFSSCEVPRCLTFRCFQRTCILYYSFFSLLLSPDGWQIQDRSQVKPSQAKPSQAKVLRAGKSLCLLAIPAFDRIAALSSRHLKTNWGMCLH